MRAPIHYVPWRRKTMQKGVTRRVGDEPEARFACTRDKGGTQGQQFLLGPAGITYTDVRLHLVGIGWSGQRGGIQTATRWKAT
jgi:hypothetical protein